jgi:hypothetical protein
MNDDDTIIARALEILSRRMRATDQPHDACLVREDAHDIGPAYSSPNWTLFTPDSWSVLHAD